MAATVPTRTPLAGSTVNRGFYLDVAAIPAGGDVTTITTWIPVMGMTDFTPHFPMGSTQDSSDFDGGGFKDQDVTALEWGAEGKYLRKVTSASATAYDPGQEFLRTQAAKLGSAAPFAVRIYEYEPGGPRVEAMTGKAVVTTDYDGGGMDALKSVSFTINGKGAPASLVHPFPGS